MDPLTQFLTTSPWVSLGGYGFGFAALIFIVTGFTMRDWSTPRMRARKDAETTAANARAESLQTTLNMERKETADKALASNLVLAEVARSQQQTIAAQDNFLKKIPVSTPQTGDTVNTAGSRGELTP